MSRKRKPAKLDAVAVAGHRRSDDSLVPPPPQRSVRWLAALLVAVFTLAAFLPTLHNQFVNWDDDVNFLDKPHYRRLGGARGQRLYWLSVALFGCALLSKSMAVSLPVVLLILEVYPLRRLGGSLGWSSASTRRVYVEKIPFVLLAAAASAITLMAQLSNS